MLNEKNYRVVIDGQNVYLRSANNTDIEYLRLLKNNHTEYFFHKQEITSNQQEAWFSAYQKRLNDFMFILMLDNNRIGCMGIRLLDNNWDVYNVILGDRDYKGTGLMGRSLQAMLGFARSVRDIPIGLSVLKNNPAIWWYKKNGFKIDCDNPAYLVMLFDHFPLGGMQ